MPRHSSYIDIARLRLPMVGNFGNINHGDYDPAVVRLHMYEYYHIGRFLYFRFDERNWIPKKALHYYNREWEHLAIPIHQSSEAKRIFFRARGNTRSSFLTGLRNVINLWLNTYSEV